MQLKAAPRGLMLVFLKRTWLPTVLFAIPIFALEVTLGGVSPPPVGTMTAVALLVVPPTWWRMVAGRGRVGLGRGAVSGALCALLILLLPAAVVVVAMAAHGRGEGFGSLVAAAWFASLAIALAVMVPVGAGLGVLAALFEKQPDAQ